MSPLATTPRQLRLALALAVLGAATPSLQAQSAPIVYPIIMSSPATGFGLGAGLVKFSRDTAGFGGPGSGHLEGLAVQSGRVSVGAGVARHLTGLLGGQWFLTADAGYSTLPVRYALAHGTNQPSASSDYTQELATAQATLRYVITDGLAVGPMAAWRSASHIMPGAPGAGPAEIASAEGTTTTLGLVATLDRRDDPYLPRHGLFVDVRASRNDARVVARDHFDRLTGELRWFTPLSERTVLAVQGVADHVSSGAPLDQLPMTGMLGTFRGIDPGQVRARSLVAAQAELRVSVNSRLGLVAYGASGSIRDDWRAMRMDDLSAAGLGLRWHPRGNPRFVVRVDVGMSGGRSSTLVGFGEAF